MSFWEIVWFIIITFAFVAYLMVLFHILTDLFRDRETSGLVKAIWIIALIFLPLLTSLMYLIVRGKGMAERSMKEAERIEAAAGHLHPRGRGEVVPCGPDRPGQVHAGLRDHLAGGVRPAEGEGTGLALLDWHCAAAAGRSQRPLSAARCEVPGRSDLVRRSGPRGRPCHHPPRGLLRIRLTLLRGFSPSAC